MDDDWKKEMEERGDNAERTAPKALYMNLGEMLESEYWHGFMFGIFIGTLAGFLFLMGRE